MCIRDSSRGHLDEETWDDVEDTLLASDLGVEASQELVAALRRQVAVQGVRDEATVRGWLREDLIRLVDPSMDRRLVSTRQGDRAAVILVAVSYTHLDVYKRQGRGGAG